MMNKLSTVGLTVLVAASLSFAQRGPTADKTREGKGAPNNSSTRDHKGETSNKSSTREHKGGKKGKRASSDTLKGWNQKSNTRK
jgi:hypothetical protein